MHWYVRWVVGLLVVCVLVGELVASPGESEESAPKAPAFAVEQVSKGHGFTEGPALDAEGRILFTDLRVSKIHRYDPKTQKTELLHEDTGKSNGLLFDGKGRLLACEGGRRRLVRHLSPGKSEVLAERFEGKRLNSPNDLTRDAAGRIYFTDPRYGSQKDRELDFEGVYVVEAGKPLRRVCAEVEKPNGILLAADGKRLYVADSKRKRILVYAVDQTGKPTNGRVFANLDLEARGGPDGMTQDATGRVMVAGQGHLWIWDATGKLYAKVKLPESPTNCCFVDSDPYVIYVTARTSLYRVTRR